MYRPVTDTPRQLRHVPGLPKRANPSGPETPDPSRQQNTETAKNRHLSGLSPDNTTIPDRFCPTTTDIAQNEGACNSSLCACKGCILLSHPPVCCHRTFFMRGSFASFALVVSLCLWCFSDFFRFSLRRKYWCVLTHPLAKEVLCAKEVVWR